MVNALFMKNFSLRIDILPIQCQALDAASSRRFCECVDATAPHDIEPWVVLMSSIPLRMKINQGHVCNPPVT
jgi:hypothetical protein